MRLLLVVAGALVTPTAMATSQKTLLRQAIHICGPVLAGYGRGGKKLGVPTANHPQFASFLRENEVRPGVYFGWGCVQDEQVTGVVANVGYSPTFVGEENKVMTVESHVLRRELATDFYGKRMHIVLGVFIRPEIKFEAFKDLTDQIALDIKTSLELMEESMAHEGSDLARLRRLAVSSIDSHYGGDEEFALLLPPQAV